ncbi:hypothetical protein SAMN05216349_11084 [Oribacterium sp. KHPX15]|uniref:hypothetical protein n=1 Tax=Oribacterium sp. KHPX15 TaxID=1855342 RepID=UPI00089D15DA|nr:hypothetical protein [Oribacterium sp. KHPX15]SEA36899.1 hypothetical protein SAMN05216349_11084 [Oribacterium sp. KHPX15]
MRVIKWLYPIIDNGESSDHIKYVENNSIEIPEVLYDEWKIKDFDYYINIIGKKDSDDSSTYFDTDNNNEFDGPYGFGSDTLLELALALRLQPILHNGFHESNSGQDSGYHEVSFHLSRDDNRQAQKISDDHDIAWKYIIYQTELMKVVDALQNYQSSHDESKDEIIDEVIAIREFLIDYNNSWIQINKSKRNHHTHYDFPKYDDPFNIPPSEETDIPFDDIFFWEAYQDLFENPKYAATMHELRRLLLKHRINSSVKQQQPYNIYEELVRNISLNHATKIILYKCIAHAFGYARNMLVINMALDYIDGISEDYRLHNIVYNLIETTRYHVASYLAGPSVKTHNIHMIVNKTSSRNKSFILDYRKSICAMRRLVNCIDQNIGNLMRYKEHSSRKKRSGCFGILEYATPSASSINYVGYYSFSGIFDAIDSTIINRSDLYDDYCKKTKKQMNTFIKKLISNSPELMSFSPAICTPDMITYRRSNGGFVTHVLGTVLNYWSIDDIKLNFSCCERKMLPLMEKNASPRGCGYIFTKFDACDICQKSIGITDTKGYNLDTLSIYTLKCNNKMQSD